MHLRLVSDLSEIPAHQWDALVGEDDPFVEHAFLRTLEESDSVGAESGWDPLHVTAWDESQLVGALPLYVKTHSFGEYIFDFSWANAAAQLGVSYYPKLVSMVPVSPVTGRRFLIADHDRARDIVSLLLEGCRQAAEQTRASSIHILFLTETERDLLPGATDFMVRLSHQFHWRNQDYRTFEDYLAQFRSAMRKQVRRERRQLREAGIEVVTRTGREIDAATWQALYGFYRATCGRYGSEPYLDPKFFELAPTTLADRAVAVIASRNDVLVGGSINFEKGANVYGRYWGAREAHEFLHFELCYYQLIERAISQGAQRFEAGAQGIHKLRRGLMPTRIWSAHWIRHPILRGAIADFLPREAMVVERQIMELSHHGPFRRAE